MNFNERAIAIKVALHKEKLRQSVLANLLGVSQPKLSKFIHGTETLTEAQAIQFYDILGLDRKEFEDE